MAPVHGPKGLGAKPNLSPQHPNPSALNWGRAHDQGEPRDHLQTPTSSSRCRHRPDPRTRRVRRIDRVGSSCNAQARQGSNRQVGQHDPDSRQLDHDDQHRALSAAQWLTSYGGIFATLENDLANAKQPAGIAAECQQLATDVVTALNDPPNPNASAAAAFQTMLNQHLVAADPDTPWSTTPVDAGALSDAGVACVNDPDPLDTLGKQASDDHLDVVIATAPALIQAAQQAAQNAAPGVPSPAPTTPAPTTTTTTAPPMATFTVTGTGPANDITILNGSQETQHNDVALPWSYSTSDYSSILGLTAQTDSGSASATITCTINSPDSGPVTNTSTGPYAVVDCTAGGF